VTTAEQLYKEAVQLPATDRKRLAVSLLRTLEDDATETAPGWSRRFDIGSTRPILGKNP
jgi:hypothetical protein